MSEQKIVLTQSDSELLSFMNEKHEQDKIESLEQMITYLREKQKQYAEGGGEVSGLETIKQMANNGTINPSMLLQLIPIVQNYNNPYKIISPDTTTHVRTLVWDWKNNCYEPENKNK